MKRLYSLLLFLLLPGVVALADPIKATLRTVKNTTFSGMILERLSGAVVFQPNGGRPPAQIEDSQIAEISFPLSSDEDEDLVRLFDDGEYAQVIEKTAPLLAPYLTYSSLPSNLRPLFMRWMSASYWTGAYDEALSLANSLGQSTDPQVRAEARFYRHLSGFEKGDFQSMESFLDTEDGDLVYPPKSAARLYIEARNLQRQEQYIPAIRKAALLIALHSRDADWMPRAELLCAEIYFQLDMPESAKSVLADISEFYSDPEIQQQAAAIAARK